MTFGISINDIVHLKNSFIIGKVVGIDDWAERHPADLMVVYEDSGEVCRIKVRADEVTVLRNVPEELIGTSNAGYLPF